MRPLRGDGATNRPPYVPGPHDADWRGSERGLDEALEEAFRQTGVPRAAFVVAEWAQSATGTAVPVEWRGPDGAEVNIDGPHARYGPDAPHVGWQRPGKRKRGGARGHILLDDVPYARSAEKGQTP